MPRQATGAEVEMIIPSKVTKKRQVSVPYDRCNLKMDTIELLAQRQSLTD